LYRESTSINNAARRYISLYEIQLWVNGTNVAASTNGGVASGTRVHTGPHTRVNDGIFLSNLFHAHNVETDNTIITHPYIDISLNANYNINDIQAALIYFRTNTTNERHRTQGIVLQLYNENDELLHTSPVTQPTSPPTLNNISTLYRYQGPAWNTLTSSHFTTGTGNSDLSSKIFNNTSYGSFPVADRPLIAQQFRKIRVQKQRPSSFSNWSGTNDTITIDKSLYMPNKTGTTDSAVDTDALSIIEIQVWVNGTNIALSTNGGVASGTTEYTSDYIASGVNDNQDYHEGTDSYMSTLGENNPFIDIELSANHNVSDIQSMIVYYPIYNITWNMRCIGTHVELYDEFDNKVYQSNSVKNPCHALRIDGPAFKYYTGSFFSNRGTSNDASFPSGIISAGSHVNFYDSNTDIVVKVNHEKMNNMLEIINTNGDTTNAGHFVAEPSISVVDSNGNVGINTSAPRAGAKLDIYNAHNPSPGYGLFPVGFTMMFCAGKDKVPSGWLLCDGSTYSTSDYPALGAILGHQGTGTDNGGNYGTTSSGQFKVPDLKEKFPILANTASNYTGLSGISVDTNGQLGNNVCNVNQLASHSHSISSSSITDDHTITVDHVLKTGALAGVDNTNKSSYPNAANTIVDSFSSNTTHLGYIPLHTNIHGQPGDYDSAINKRRQQVGLYFNDSTNNSTLHYGVYHFVSHEYEGRTTEMFPRIEVKASDANLKPTMNLQNAGGTDHRRPQYTVVNFIMYSGVHETTTYGTKGWSS
jgi:microcystin-dependent protein